MRNARFSGDATRDPRYLVRMQIRQPICFAAAALAVFLTALTYARPPVVTADEVMQMTARIPAECSLVAGKTSCTKLGDDGEPVWKPGHYERSPEARRIAQAIAAVAPTRSWAATMAVFAAYESTDRITDPKTHECVRGDGGKARGPWQLHWGSDETACDPVAAARVWLNLAEESIRRCGDNDPDERLASVAGGCKFPAARRIVRRRIAVAKAILQPAAAPALADDAIQSSPTPGS